ncbi:MAG: hypothetical protein JWO36_1508 [Myxococcales bacterium]|nr:hypothetical protein [Myxococcales bacterium]
MGGLYGVRFRAVLTAVQHRNSVNAWHLRQLLPMAAESATTLKSGPITQR